MCQLTLLWAWASVVGLPSPSRLPSGPDGCGDGVGSWLTRVKIVCTLIQSAIATRVGVYTTKAANTTNTAAAASAHRLWNHGRRTIGGAAGAAMRASTRAASAGVTGQSISSRKRVRRCSSWVALGTGALLYPHA